MGVRLANETAAGRLIDQVSLEGGCTLQTRGTTSSLPFYLIIKETKVRWGGPIRASYRHSDLHGDRVCASRREISEGPRPCLDYTNPRVYGQRKLYAAQIVKPRPRGKLQKMNWHKGVILSTPHQCQDVLLHKALHLFLSAAVASTCHTAESQTLSTEGHLQDDGCDGEELAWGSKLHPVVHLLPVCK